MRKANLTGLSLPDLDKLPHQFSNFDAMSVAHIAKP